LFAIAVGTSGCMPRIIQQGNVLDPQKVEAIQVGATRFSVESLLGTPVMHDIMHPNKATYIEEYSNAKTHVHYIRGIIITYDDALRVASVQRFGFKPAVATQ
jgi:outer membrane protein assembly factor BamE (lipoprotein component of BamABCDE complex)